MSSTTPKSSTPKSKAKSSVYVSQVTPSPAPASTSTISNGNSQNGCLSSSGSYEVDRVNVSFKVAGNGETNGGSLEDSGSSQHTNEVEKDRRVSANGEKGCVVGSEEGASQESGKGEDGASSGGAVPKINTSKREREREREMINT